MKRYSKKKEKKDIFRYHKLPLKLGLKFSFGKKSLDPYYRYENKKLSKLILIKFFVNNISFHFIITKNNKNFYTIYNNYF